MSEPEFERFWRRLLGPPLFGRPGFRDPNGLCEEFDGEGYNGKGDCDSDGHYLCEECSHLGPKALRFTEYGRDGRRDRLRLFWRYRAMQPTHTDFWTMAREIRDYCKKTGLSVVVQDDSKLLYAGFTTACPASDTRCKHWSIRLSDISVTANKRPADFEGLSQEDMVRITHPWLWSSDTRAKVAEYFSTGQLPPPKNQTP